MRTIQYVTPPETRGRPSVESDVADFLREIAWRKGEWAIYREGMRPSTAYVYVSRFHKRFPHAEFTARKQDDGTATLYARVLYV